LFSLALAMASASDVSGWSATSLAALTVAQLRTLAAAAGASLLDIDDASRENIDDMKEHISNDYLPNDQVTLASADLFDSADHCIKSYTKDIKDLTNDQLLEMLDDDDLTVLGEDNILFI